MASRIKYIILVFIAAALFSPPPAEAAERIVSLYPGHTDNIIALGGAKRLVAVSKNDDGDTLPALPRFSVRTGAEEILALKPDLVLTRGLAERQNPQLREVLERAGVEVASLEPPDWNGFGGYLKRLAKIVGTDPSTAEAKLKKIRSEIARAAAAKSRGKHPSVFVEATQKELHTCSPDSWAARLIELAGGRNAAAEARPIRRGSAIAPWGLERMLKSAASGEIAVYIIQQGAMNAGGAKAAAARPWAAALKKAKIVEMPEGELSRPSLPGLEAGGKRLIKIFYGE